MCWFATVYLCVLKSRNYPVFYPPPPPVSSGLWDFFPSKGSLMLISVSFCMPHVPVVDILSIKAWPHRTGFSVKYQGWTLRIVRLPRQLKLPVGQLNFPPNLSDRTSKIRKLFYAKSSCRNRKPYQWVPDKNAEMWAGEFSVRTNYPHLSDRTSLKISLCPTLNIHTSTQWVKNLKML